MKVVKEIMKTRYFYCSSENCDNIKENDRIFCDKHTIYNVKKLRESILEIRSIDQKLVMTDIQILYDRIKYCNEM